MRTTNILLAGAALLCFSSAANAATYYSQPTYYQQPAEQRPVSSHFNRRPAAQPVYQQQPAYQQPAYQQPAPNGGYYSQPRQGTGNVRNYNPAPSPYVYQNPQPSYGNFSQYVALRGIYSKMTNDVDYTFKSHMQDNVYSDTYAYDADDDTFGGSLAYGLKYNFWRAEIEASLYGDSKGTAHDEDWGDLPITIQKQALMLNLYADLDNPSIFTPYIGGGVGYARLKAKWDDFALGIERSGGSKSKGNFVWQIGAGLNIAATENISFELGYRYMYNGKLTVEGAVVEQGIRPVSDEFKLDSFSHMVTAGLRYSF